MLRSIDETAQLQRIVDAITSHGLGRLAILCLVAGRPFRYLLNQLMVIVAPLLGWDNGLGTMRYGWLLEDQEQFDYLIAMFEEPAEHAHSEAEQ
jgi:hypothetical protein